MALDPLFCGRIFVSVFFAILFLQSGFDKVTDWKGNLDWLSGHFASSPLRGMVPLMLGTVTIVELSAGLANAIGAVGMFIPSMPALGVLGLSLASLALVMLFFGQRVAKDYAGAATLACYFGVALLGFALWAARPA
ncbi:MAG: DoxX family protein [Armatimonadetes bacterium]|nr:DoxX family protein [Armatimonadota bacterium]